MPEKQLLKTVFKTCNNCGISWKTRSEFIDCPSITLMGYQSNFDSVDEGLFLFNHTIKSCGSTVAVPVAKFTDLYTGERYSDPRFGAEECKRRCIDQSNIELCEAKCRYAYVREILQILRKSKI